jgi:hypothetical protein
VDAAFILPGDQVHPKLDVLAAPLAASGNPSGAALGGSAFSAPSVLALAALLGLAVALLQLLCRACASRRQSAAKARYRRVPTEDWADAHSNT